MIPYSRPKCSDLTLSQSKLLQNHTLHSVTYLYNPYMAVPPPPPRGRKKIPLNTINIVQRTPQLTPETYRYLLCCLWRYNPQILPQLNVNRYLLSSNRILVQSSCIIGANTGFPQNSLGSREKDWFWLTRLCVNYIDWESCGTNAWAVSPTVRTRQKPLCCMYRQFRPWN